MSLFEISDMRELERRVSKQSFFFQPLAVVEWQQLWKQAAHTCGETYPRNSDMLTDCVRLKRNVCASMRKCTRSRKYGGEVEEVGWLS
jgi:hypothetical protein